MAVWGLESMKGGGNCCGRMRESCGRKGAVMFGNESRQPKTRVRAQKRVVELKNGQSRSKRVSGTENAWFVSKIAVRGVQAVDIGQKHRKWVPVVENGCKWLVLVRKRLLVVPFAVSIQSLSLWVPITRFVSVSGVCW